MKVKIIQRSVYHKIAEVEVEVPDTIKNENVQSYIMDIEDQWVDIIDAKINQADFVFGKGIEDGDWTEDEESEWRYEIVGKQYGGHL